MKFRPVLAALPPVLLLLFISPAVVVEGLLGGILAQHNEFPSLLLLKGNGAVEGSLPVCGGVLIWNRDYFLTATTCDLPEPIEQTTIVYGEVHDSGYDEIEMQHAPLFSQS